MKGQVSYPFTMIEAAFTFILVMSVAVGSQTYTANFIAQETTDIRADRVENAAIVLENYEAGSIEIDISSYEVKVEGSEFYLRFENEENLEEVRNLESIGYSDIEGPGSYEAFSSVCLEKNFDNELIIGESC